MPKVSVVLSTHNDEKYIREAVESILNQTFKNFEFIIVNDGSDDRTGEILDKFSDNRIRILHQSNIGISKSRRKAIELSIGEYIAIQDGDDISLPERLERQANFLDNNKDIGLVGTAGVEIEEDSTILDTIYFPEDNDIIQKILIKENCFCSASIMFRKYIYEKIGGYNPEFGEVCEDYDLLLRFAEWCNLHSLQEVLYKRRVNTKSLTFTRNRQMEAYILLARTLAQERRAGRDENLERNKARIIGKIDENMKKNTFIANLSKKYHTSLLLSKHYYGAGCIPLYKGDLIKARKLFFRSLRHNLFNIKGYICLFLTLLPFNLVKLLKFLFKATARYYRSLN